MKLNLMVMLFMSSIMSNVNHPLLLSMMVMIQNVMVCLYMRFMTSSAWIPLTMFLVIVGGLMVIFMYTTSICSNIKFNKLNLTKSFIYFLLIFIMLPPEFYPMNNNENIQLMDLFNTEMYKLYLPINLMSSLFLFIYLLMALLIMISMLNKEKGPMRKKY
uniref:NADH dehydrogenase subunit 6 n=1 Tax=Livia junci TaxID=1449964 RepID=A0A344A2J3_9HEMI|nr:NADH dehydrogenase subunit 6 [Livia junci]AWU48984.1 NADH dehydrogenase subunit 6 [Livia junci]